MFTGTPGWLLRRKAERKSVGLFWPVRRGKPNHVPASVFRARVHLRMRLSMPFGSTHFGASTNLQALGICRVDFAARKAIEGGVNGRPGGKRNSLRMRGSRPTRGHRVHPWLRSRGGNRIYARRSPARKQGCAAPPSPGFKDAGKTFTSAVLL